MVAGDRLPDRIGIGILAKVFPPELVDRVVGGGGPRARSGDRARCPPGSSCTTCWRLALFFASLPTSEVMRASWSRAWTWARRVRARVSLAMQPTPAALFTARAQAAGAGSR